MNSKSPLSLVVSAPSGTGKTTIIKRLLEGDARFEFSVSTTTRPRRPGEVDGRSYYFVTEDEFVRMRDRGDFVEWALVHGRLYGTLKKEVDRLYAGGKIPVFDVDVQGARQLRNTIGDAVYVFIIPPSLEVLKQRLRDRETESPEQLRLRIENAIKELREYMMYDYIIVNRVVDESLECLKSIIGAELCRTRRMEGIIKDWRLERDNPAG